MNLDVQISWQARYIVNFEMLLCTRLCALRFVLVCALTFVLVNLDVQMFLKGVEFQSHALAACHRGKHARLQS